MIAIFLHKVYTAQQPNDILIHCNTLSLTSLTLTLFLSMIHNLLHFFRERNQANLTLVVVKFYNGLRTYIIVNV